jgi:TIGR03009 family protein
MAHHLSRAIAIVIVCLTANSLWAQTQSETWPRPNPIRPSTQSNGPDQPVNPQLPMLERRAAPDMARQSKGQPGNQAQGVPSNQRQISPQEVQQPQQLPPAPFTLTPQEEQLLDRVLAAWEKKSKEIETFDCSFKRWEYDPIFPKPNAKPNAPVNIDLGILKYKSPDRGVFRVLNTESPEGKQTPIEEDRADHWICDGKSVFQYIPIQKKLVEYKLPPEMQGKAIVNGPLPFLFGAEAQKLRQRYWIRIVTPPNQKMQVWLEAHPKFQADAANYRMATLVLSTPDMTPKALQIILPNGKSRTSYEFYDIVLNDPLRFFQGSPFQAFVPRGWQKVDGDAPTAQAGRPAAPAR